MQKWNSFWWFSSSLYVRFHVSVKTSVNHWILKNNVEYKSIEVQENSWFWPNLDFISQKASTPNFMGIRYNRIWCQLNSWVADELSLISRFRGSSGLGKKFEDDFPLYYSMSISSQFTFRFQPVWPEKNMSRLYNSRFSVASLLWSVKKFEGDCPLWR